MNHQMTGLIFTAFLGIFLALMMIRPVRRLILRMLKVIITSGWLMIKLILVLGLLSAACNSKTTEDAVGFTLIGIVAGQPSDFWKNLEKKHEKAVKSKSKKTSSTTKRK